MKASNVYKNMVSQILDAMNNNPKDFFSGINFKRPFNLVTNKEYKGINYVYLSLLKNYQAPAWLTFLQGQKIGLKVKRNERSQTVVFFKPVLIDPETKKIVPDDVVQNLTKEEVKKLKSSYILSYFNVFNIEQFDNHEKYSQHLFKTEFKPVSEIENFIRSSQNLPPITHKYTEYAYYSSKHDELVMPFKSQYQNEMDYYLTLLHEIIHSTGAPHRLNRNSMLNYSIQTERAYEELVAEFGAAFLANALQINIKPNLENIAAYIKSWNILIQDKPNLLFKAASDAEKAVEFLLGKNYKPKQQPVICAEMA